MPSASVPIAASGNAGVLRRLRKAKRKSLKNVPMPLLVVSDEDLTLAVPGAPVVPPDDRSSRQSGVRSRTLASMTELPARYDHARTMRQTIVLGAGLQGVCVALALRRAGHRVTLIDREPECL